MAGAVYCVARFCVACGSVRRSAITDRVRQAREREKTRERASSREEANHPTSSACLVLPPNVRDRLDDPPLFLLPANGGRRDAHSLEPARSFLMRYYASYPVDVGIPLFFRLYISLLPNRLDRAFRCLAVLSRFSLFIRFPYRLRLGFVPPNKLIDSH